MKERGRREGDVILLVLNLEAMNCRMQIDSTLEKGGGEGGGEGFFFFPRASKGIYC